MDRRVLIREISYKRQEASQMKKAEKPQFALFLRAHYLLAHILFIL